MKGTNAFKETIGNYIIANNIDIAKHPDKTLDGCIDYIFTTVQKSGCNGFTDDEIFGMAVHYFDEPNEALGDIKHLTPNVVANHHVELTEKEKEQARKEAFEEVKQQQINNLTKKEQKPVKQPEKQCQGQMELF
ncbi:MAG: PcfK-like family protein [Prevotella sp.]|nr:PcfK-like family protein [Prevotella sp.]